MHEGIQGRTVRQFSSQSPDDIWGIVNSWASQNGYKQKATTENSALYQHGNAFWSAWPPHKVQVSRSGDQYQIEAWVYLHPIHWLNHLMYPTETPLEFGSKGNRKAREKARNELNPLLQTLGLAPIVEE